MARFWCSFWSDDPSKWEYHGPWWISGYRDLAEAEQSSICCAVVAEDEEHAKRIIEAAHDKGHAPAEWRFVNPLEGAPFNGRFKRAKWMKWPWPEAK